MKAEDTVTIDLTGKSTLGDYMIVTSGRSNRHVGAIADHVMEGLHAAGIGTRVEGMPHCDWVLIDAGDVIVHVFRPEVRDFYSLERMWSGNAGRRKPDSDRSHAARGRGDRKGQGWPRPRTCGALPRARREGRAQPRVQIHRHHRTGRKPRASAPAIAWPRKARRSPKSSPAMPCCVALDGSGTAQSSEAFAAQLGKWRDAGREAVFFIIGGADGLSAGHPHAGPT